VLHAIRLGFGLSFSLSIASLPGQVEPPPAASDYPYHCQVGEHEFGVEYLGRQLPVERSAYYLPQILVFELGVFPAADQTLQIGTSNLEFVRNGNGYAQPPTDAEYVRASLLHPEWNYESKPRLIGGVSSGSGAVILGGPDTSSPRFPGDPRAESRHPTPVPNPTPRTSKSDGGLQDAMYTVTANALPRHLIDRPTSGYAYFSYSKKLKKLKKIELRVRLNDDVCSLVIDPRNISRSLDRNRRGRAD